MTTTGTNAPEIIVGTTGPTVPPRHLTVPEAAERVGLSQRALRRALSEGRMSGVNMAGRWMIPEAALDEYARTARRHRTNGAAERAAQHEASPDLAPLVDELRHLLDRAVAAEVRAAKAEGALAQLESGPSEADALRARVAELEEQLARRRRWWPWRSSPAVAAAPQE